MQIALHSVASARTQQGSENGGWLDCPGLEEKTGALLRPQEHG
jgi:hypothetical protein